MEQLDGNPGHGDENVEMARRRYRTCLKVDFKQQKVGAIRRCRARNDSLHVDRQVIWSISWPCCNCHNYAMMLIEITGAAMAVEDAAALAQSIQMMSEHSELERAIEIYEKVRSSRTRLVHEASYRHAYTAHLPDGSEQRARDEAMEDEVAGRHFIQSPNQWSDPTTQRWAYGYDPAGAIRAEWGR